MRSERTPQWHCQLESEVASSVCCSALCSALTRPAWTLKAGAGELVPRQEGEMVGGCRPVGSAGLAGKGVEEAAAPNGVLRACSSQGGPGRQEGEVWGSYVGERKEGGRREGRERKATGCKPLSHTLSTISQLPSEEDRQSSLGCVVTGGHPLRPAGSSLHLACFQTWPSSHAPRPAPTWALRTCGLVGSPQSLRHVYQPGFATLGSRASPSLTEEPNNKRH